MSTEVPATAAGAVLVESQSMPEDARMVEGCDCRPLEGMRGAARSPATDAGTISTAAWIWTDFWPRIGRRASRQPVWGERSRRSTPWSAPWGPWGGRACAPSFGALTAGRGRPWASRAVTQRNWRLSDEPPAEDEDEELKDPKVRASTKCTIFFSYTSNLISSGLREAIRFLVQHKMVRLPGFGVAVIGEVALGAGARLRGA